MIDKSSMRWVASKTAGLDGFGAAASALATLAHRVSATAFNPTGFDIYLSDFVCDVSDDTYSGAHYQEITLRNCGRVRRFEGEVEEAISDALHEIVDESEAQRQDWSKRKEAAVAACEEAQILLKANEYVSAANVSVNAWGSILMQGKECCTLTRPPYCIDKDWSGATVAMAFPPVISVLLLIGAMLAALRKKPLKEPKQEQDPSYNGEERRPAEVLQTRKQLGNELYDEWVKRSPLRDLPWSKEFASSAASLFASLWDCFDFQEASVVNQFEHLISLLRSQVAMVADRRIGRGRQVDERDLLPEALGDLSAELLDGFYRWRAKFKEHLAADGLPKLCGADWQHISPAAGGANANEMSKQLAEISAFLLVWGEAGNVRFMPEVLYFITELVLESDPAGEQHNVKDLYQLKEAPLEIWEWHTSGLFLSRIIRPIYNVIFEEWYEKVDVNSNTKKDEKELREDLRAFIPPHVANYDDWNEFVASPDKLVEGLVQQGHRAGDKPLFTHPPGQRFRELARVDWKTSLDAGKIKTHRELHSLWGVFAATHRVILVHTVLFFAGVVTVYNEKDIPDSPDGEWLLLGQATSVRYAVLGLLVPLHAVAWGIAQWQVTGPALRTLSFTMRFQNITDLCMSFCQPAFGCPADAQGSVRCFLWKPWLIFFLIPAVTYHMIRSQENRSGDYDGDGVSTTLLIVHFVLSGYLCGNLLLVPDYRYRIFPFETLTPVPLLLRVVRYTFWGSILTIKFFLGMVVARAVSDAMESLEISRPGMQSWHEITKVWFTSDWAAAVLQWHLFWFTNFYLFFTDTALWYVAGCGILGMLTTLVQRHQARNTNAVGKLDRCPLVSFVSEDAVAKIPQRFSQKVLFYAEGENKFPIIWDRICQYMQYEDKLDSLRKRDLSYDGWASNNPAYWKDLWKDFGSGTGHPQRLRVPSIFLGNTPVELCCKSYGCIPDQDWPSNADIQWRITALARGLGLPMPRPYRCPYMPGLTVLIPHYGEAILMQRDDLFPKVKSETVPLIDWLTHRYDKEFDNFTSRMRERFLGKGDDGWPVIGRDWDEYTPDQWKNISNWAAMRYQTLFRTVAGMCDYHPAIQAHFELQGKKDCSLGRVWNASDCFTCIVSMQMYVFFDDKMANHTKYMLDKFPNCLKVAYIDYAEKGQHAKNDLVHKHQKRRYFSCLIDRDCKPTPDEKTWEPRHRIELPGYPILGDGKGDNQNHAIIFMRGHYAQCIDANQGAYFEQMLLLPVALAELRSEERGGSGGKKIIGFPEHITSDLGSIGDFAASAEVAFGTILQRTYAVLGARMHYGHPDIMNKLFMIQQGGVSKATKTINLSEDIFAGMDFTLRGNGRTIKHCEYFNLAKGRDLGFNTVLGFFSKLSSGTGEQVLTRQVFRLGQVLHLPEALSFYYSHAGYYFTQFFVSWALPLLVFTWLLVLASDCDDNFASVQHCDRELDLRAADAMAGLLATSFSWVMLFFLFATMFPLFIELWMQRSLGFAAFKVAMAYLTMAPLLFVFQAKCIGHYVVNEFRYGGAKYVATGRGLPTQRRPFIGETHKLHLEVECKPGDLILESFDVDLTDVGRVARVQVGGQAEKLGVMRGDLVTSSLGMPLSIWDLDRMKGNTRNCTIVIKRSYLKLKKPDGLYLDYAAISFYDGATLLFGVLLVFLAGGVPNENVASLAWVFVSLALTIIAWLYGPFVFNPYQFEASHFCSDLRAILAFFLESKGKHWVEWYDRTQLKAGHGLTATLIDITFFMFSFAVSVWYLSVNAKVHAFASIYSQYTDANQLYFLVLLPPVFASYFFTAIGAVLEVCGGRPGTVWSYLIDRVAKLKKLEALKSGVAVRVTKTGSTSTAPPATPHCGFRVGIPLPLSAIIVALFDIAEAFFFLREFYRVEWYRGLLAGLILKWFLLSAVTMFGEGVLRSKRFIMSIECYVPLGLSLATWVCAHRMLRDILTASLVFLPQSLLMLLNEINRCLCPTCNCHQLCLYRDPGHIKRIEQKFTSLNEQKLTSVNDPHKGVAPAQAAMTAATPVGKSTLAL